MAHRSRAGTQERRPTGVGACTQDPESKRFCFVAHKIKGSHDQRAVGRKGRSRSRAVGDFKVRVGARTLESARTQESAHRSRHTHMSQHTPLECKRFCISTGLDPNILHFDSLDQNLLDSTSLKCKIFCIAPLEMQNPLDFIGHGGSGSCTTPSLDRRSLPWHVPQCSEHGGPFLKLAFLRSGLIG
jgi:hypothetical protein